MIRGLLGKKLGMTQIFGKDGNVVPVSVIEAGPCTVLGLMDQPVRVKLGFDVAKDSGVNKPASGFFKKIGVAPCRVIREVKSDDNKDYKIGQAIKVDMFRPGDFVDVSATSIGKGFQGGMKRWNWKGGKATHGSMHHRRVGSVSSSADPSRVWRGAHMPGHMGGHNVTVQGLRVMDVDLDHNILLIDGAIPGHRNALVVISRSKKKAYKSLDEKPVVHIKKINPMKQSKAKAKGK